MNAQPFIDFTCSNNSIYKRIHAVLICKIAFVNITTTSSKAHIECKQMQYILNSLYVQNSTATFNKHDENKIPNIWNFSITS